jgi:hypothetical protein
MKRYNLNIILLLVGFLIYPHGVSIAQEPDRSVDNVPRDRLVTDTELLDLLDTKIVKSEDRNSVESFVEYLITRKVPKYFFGSKEMGTGFDEYLKKFPTEENRIKDKVNNYQTTYGNDIDWLLPSIDQHGRSLTPNSIRYIARFPLAFEYALKSLVDDNFDSANDFFLQLTRFY